MIKTTAMLLEELKKYVNPTAKIRQLVKASDLFPIVRGIYETDRTIPGYYLAPIIYGPSYLSFEYALSYYSLIPEAVYTFTCATFEKRKAKQYDTLFGTFTYRDVPSKAYPVGVVLHAENGYGFQIASAEKALCDQLCLYSPLKNRTELKQSLFDDLRIDPDDFSNLNLAELSEIASHYHTQNHRLLKAYVQRSIKNGSSD